MDKQDLRIKKTLAKLTQALLELLESKFLTKITVNEVCIHAQVHRTTFYKHFNGKCDLFEYAFQTVLTPFFDLTFKSRVQSPFKCIEATFTDQMFRVLNYQKDDPVFYDIALNLFSKIFSEELYENKEDLPFEDSLPIELLSYVYASMINAMNQWRVDHDVNFDPPMLDMFYQSMLKAKMISH